MDTSISEKTELLNLRKKLYNDSKQDVIQDFYYQLELEKRQKPIINALSKIEEKQPIENQKELRNSISPGPIGAKYLARGERKDERNSFFKLIDNQVFLKNQPLNFLGDNLIINQEIIPMTENLYKLISRDKTISIENLNKKEKETYYYLANNLNFFNGEKGSVGYNSNDFKIFKKIREEIEQPRELPQIQEVSDNPQSLKEIQGEIEEPIGSGLIIADPKYLNKRLKLLLAGKRAGNTSLDNEISDIIKYLYQEKRKLTKREFQEISKNLFT